jgi:hypothetical protein
VCVAGDCLKNSAANAPPGSTSTKPPASTTSAPTSPKPVKATLGRTKGDVTISRDGNTFQEANGGEQLRGGDEIQTGPDGTATLRLPDGSTITLEPNTQISIASLIAQRDDLKVRMNLRFGKIAAKVNKSRAEVSDYSIKIPTATASILGTTFTAAYRSGRSVVAVSSGAVYVKPVRASIKPAIVAAGSAVEVTASTLVASGPPVKTPQRAIALVKAAILETATVCKSGPASIEARPVAGSGNWTITAKLQLSGTAAEALFQITAGVLRPANRTAGMIATGCRT